AHLDRAVCAVSGGVVTPARYARRRRTEGLVSAEAVLGQHAGARDVDVAYGLAVGELDIGGTREEVGPAEREAHRALATAGDGDRGEQHVLAVYRHIPLVGDAGEHLAGSTFRGDCEEGDAHPGWPGRRGHGRVHPAVQGPAHVNDLVHSRYVGVDGLQGFVVVYRRRFYVETARRGAVLLRCAGVDRQAVGLAGQHDMPQGHA